MKAQIKDHVGSKVILSKEFENELDAVKWVHKELKGWMTSDDQVAIENHENRIEYLIICSDGGCLDYFGVVYLENIKKVGMK